METRSSRLMFIMAVLLRCPSVDAQAVPQVSLQSNVDNVVRQLTPNLKLKLTFDGVSVPDTVFQSIVSIAIKREDNDEEVATLTPVGSATYVIKREDTDEEVATLNPVGSVTYISPHEAKVFNAFRDGGVNGEITGKKGFLEVMARHPNISHTGNFVGVVKTLNIEGDTEDYTASKTVSISNGTIEDIITELNTLKDEVKNKVVKKPEFNGLKDEVKNKVVKKTEFNNLKNKVVKKPEFNNLKNEVVRKQEITQGLKDCRPPKVYKMHYVNVNFGRTYAKPPRVFLSHQYTRGDYVGFVPGHNNNYIEADQITTTGFRLGCSAMNIMADLDVNWIAFPSA